MNEENNFSKPQLLARASAPGKVILVGEHAVVYGVQAIAAAVGDLRVSVTIRTHASESLIVQLPRLDNDATDDHLRLEWSFEQLQYSIISCIDAYWDKESVCTPNENITTELAKICASGHDKADTAFIPTLFLTCCILFHEIQAAIGPGFCVEIETPSLPVAAGLGSSAAVSVATAAALLEAADEIKGTASMCSRGHKITCVPSSHFVEPSSKTVVKPCDFDLRRVNAWAHAAETIFHGTPSGVDDTVATFGGAIAYAKHRDPAFVQLQHLPDLSLMVTNTKVPKSTHQLVARVKEFHTEKQCVANSFMDSIGATSNVVVTLNESRKLFGDESCPADQFLDIIGPQLVAAHKMLSFMGVGHPKLDCVAETAAEFGAWTKLTGAGGGGCAISLLPLSVDDAAKTALRQKLQSMGFACFFTTLGGEGVLIDTHQ